MLGRYGALFFSVLMLVVALFVVCFDILPHWQKRSVLQLLVQETTKEFEQKKKQREQLWPLAVDTEKEDISNLYLLMQQSGLQVKSLELAKKQEREGVKLLHFSAEARFSEVQKLITVFNHSPHFVLLDFSERMRRAEQHVFEGDVLLLDQPKKSMVGGELLNINPFCVSAADYPIQSSLIPSVEGMQMVAYLQQGQKVQAVMRLVNGELLTIEQGQLLGHMKVVDIKHDGVVIQFSNHQLILVNSQGRTVINNAV